MCNQSERQRTSIGSIVTLEMGTTERDVSNPHGIPSIACVCPIKLQMNFDKEYNQ
jgi:hypothetical protein